jgi:hypothetical protein
MSGQASKKLHELHGEYLADKRNEHGAPEGHVQVRPEREKLEQEEDRSGKGEKEREECYDIPSVHENNQ